MDCSLLYVPQFFKDFFFLLTFNFTFIKLFVVVAWFYRCCIFFFQDFLFPYWTVFPAGSLGSLASSSPSWVLQSGM